jgi:hypothetical protein
VSRFGDRQRPDIDDDSEPEFEDEEQRDAFGNRPPRQYGERFPMARDAIGNFYRFRFHPSSPTDQTAERARNQNHIMSAGKSGNAINKQYRPKKNRTSAKQYGGRSSLRVPVALVLGSLLVLLILIVHWG